MLKKNIGIWMPIICLLWPHSLKAEADGIPVCLAAISRLNYGDLLVVPEDTQALIASYRDDWKNLCDSYSKAKPALADVLTKAKEIEKKFSQIFETEHTEHPSNGNPEINRAKAIHEDVSKNYLGFIPAFKGSYMEYEYFSPDLTVFKKHSSMGTREDRKFFNSQIGTDRLFMPWIEPTWDYGGCIKFGQFDWTKTMKEILHLKKVLHSKIYQVTISKFEADMFDALDLQHDVCACDDKDSVKNDLQTTAAYLAKEPPFSAFVPVIQKSLNTIESQTIKINSEKEKHCSGG